MNRKQAAIFAIVGILLASTLSMAIESAVARPLLQANSSHRLMQASWLRMNGNITQWGTTDVRGQLQTESRTAVHQSSDSKQVASATAIWSTNISREIQSVRARENFTYVYYVAKLANSSVTSLTSTSTSYTLSGTWNLLNITSRITVNVDDATGNITKVHRDQDIIPSQANGELKIADNKFTLQIDGKDALTGTVYRSITRSWYNPFKMTDDGAINTITRTDVRELAKCYGAMPGWGQYNSNMDFNNNYRVDISDISTVAANM